MTKQDKKTKFLWIFILHLLLLFNSLSGVLSKLASAEEFFSPMFILIYAGEIAVLFVYALAWQQVLKHLPLTVAFSNKSLAMIWSMLWGVFLFEETITPVMIIGAVIVLVGVILVVTSNE